MNRFSEILQSLRPGKSNHIRVILLCLFAATTFWFLNALNENYSTTLKYPIEFMYDKESYMPVGELPENVQLNVSGLGWNLFRNSVGIKVTPLEIPLETPNDVKKIVGAALPGLISEQLNEFQLNYVLTDTLYFDIQRRISRTFLLEVDSTQISLDENYKIVNNVQFDPDSVLLQGPEDILTAMSDTVHVNIPQKSIDEDYNEDVPINIPNTTLIRRNPPTVHVTFRVEEFTNDQRSVPLRVVNFPDNVDTPKMNMIVSYLVSTARKDEVTKDLFEIILDYKKMDTSDSTIKPYLLNSPDFLQGIKLDTTRVKIQLNE